MSAARKDGSRFASAKFRWLQAVARDAAVGALGVRVAALLIDQVKQETGVAWRSQEHLAEWCGVSDRAVRSGLGELCKAGHLETLRQGARKVNRYRLMLQGEPVTGSWLPISERNDTSGHPAGDRKQASCMTGSTLPQTSFLSPFPSGANAPERGGAVAPHTPRRRGGPAGPRGEGKASTAAYMVEAGFQTWETS